LPDLLEGLLVGLRARHLIGCRGGGIIGDEAKSRRRTGLRSGI
jgi:hypothetical protein